MLWGWGLGIGLLALLVGPVVFLLTGRRSTTKRDPLAILRERYARGEIDAAEFDERSRVLRGGASAGKSP